MPEYSSAGTRARLGRDLNGGEIGCYLSHVIAARAIVETGAPFGLVLEDDIIPCPDALARIHALLRWQRDRGAPDWDLCHLGKWRDKLSSPLATLDTDNGPMTIKRAHYFPVTTPALLWTQMGAQAFLRHALPITAPVDNVLRSWLCETDRGIAVTPPVFCTIEGPSTIDSTATQRKGQGRSLWYGWLKHKRMYRDKGRALHHKIRRALQSGKQ